MRIKNSNLEYYVFYEDFGHRGTFKKVNILRYLAEDIAKHIRSSKNSYKHIDSRDTLIDYLKTEFMYHYWSKCEYEYGLCSLWTDNLDDIQKKDVWFQIEPNLGMIADYIIYKMNIKFDKEVLNETNKV